MTRFRMDPIMDRVIIYQSPSTLIEESLLINCPYQREYQSS